MTSTPITLAVVALAVGAAWWWRRRHPSPFPASLSWLLETPPVQFSARSSVILDLVELAPGMRVLDVGCGAGRVTIAAARRIGPEGEIVGLDVQPGMIEKLRGRARSAELTNITTIQSPIEEADLEIDAFDRALLVGVLGEVVDRSTALRKIFIALRPGGVLSVTEVFVDPDYQRAATVRRLCEGAGLKFGCLYRRWTGFTMNFVKPRVPH